MIGICAAMLLAFAAPDGCAVDVPVEPGDTLTAIAEEHDTDWRRLWDANDQLAHPDVLAVGELVTVPRPDVDVGARPLPQPRVAARAVRSRTAEGSAPATHSEPSAGAWGRVSSCIRRIESGGDYRAVNPSGKYRGAYQFDRATFASVGGHGDPAAASPAEQDAAAYRLWRSRGLQPWPTPARSC